MYVVPMYNATATGKIRGAAKAMTATLIQWYITGSSLWEADVLVAIDHTTKEKVWHSRKPLLLDVT